MKVFLPSSIKKKKKLKLTNTKGLSKLFEANYNKANQEIQKYIEMPSKLILDFSSGIQIIRMNVSPGLFSTCPKLYQ